MKDDVEEILGRELHEVASGLQIPACPPLPQQERVQSRTPFRLSRLSRLSRHFRLFRWPGLVAWRPVLVAAVTIAVVGGAFGVLSFLDGGRPHTATPPPTQSPSVPTGDPSVPTDKPTSSTEKPTTRPLTADTPTVPYLLDGRLYAGGEQVSGKWVTLLQAGATWAAQRDDETWSWGTGPERNAIPGTVILQPRLSPDGGLLAVGAITEDGGRVLLIDTRSGATVNTLPFDAAGSDDPNALGVVAVTRDSKVFLRDGRVNEDESVNQRLWFADQGDRTVDLATTAPDQQVRGNTAAGLIVFDETKDGWRDAFYLAAVSDSGTLTRLRALPSEESVVNPSGTWLAYGGSWGGESQTAPEVAAQQTKGSQKLTLSPPDEGNLLRAKAWEDDDLLLVELDTGGGPAGLARCSIREEACVAIDLP
ncbi:hypothetical protein [Streptomyces sp. KLOTTS4A1]|uniref:hypothetical protein n=1 Tax=Streptomyces sp. KLOTTS4A1 TaxID=3390996 RepID=UPI0039F46D62